MGPTNYLFFLGPNYITAQFKLDEATEVRFATSEELRKADMLANLLRIIRLGESNNL